MSKPSDGATDIAFCPGKMRSDEVGPEELLELLEREGDAQHHAYLSFTL